MYLYVPGPISHAFLTLPFWTVNSSMLTISPYAYPFCLVDSSAELLFLDCDSSLTCLPFMTVCTCISQSHIYTVGDEDSFLIFNLLCNHPTSVKCEIPRTLHLPSSSLAKATCFTFLRSSSPLSTCLPVVKSSLRVYFGTLVTLTAFGHFYT